LILQEDAYAAGEWFKFRIHYGIVNASYLTLEVKDATLNKKLRSRKAIGMSRFFFKVDDLYKATLIRIPKSVPVCSKKSMKAVIPKPRRIFNQAANKVLVKDYKNKNEKTLCSKKHARYFIYVLLFKKLSWN
jgi:hypothetical protein